MKKKLLRKLINLIVGKPKSVKFDPISKKARW
jgi:hypothetical protein